MSNLKEQKSKKPKRNPTNFNLIQKVGWKKINLIIIFILISSLFLIFIGDLNKMNQPVSIVDSVDYNKNSSLVVIVQKIDPNNGIANVDFKFRKFDKNLSQSNLSQSKIKVIVHSGGVINFGDYLSPDYDSILHRTQFIMDPPTISEYDKINELYYEKKGIPIKIEEIHKSYLYPFDKYFIQLNFMIQDEEGNLLDSIIYFKLEDSEFTQTNPIANIAYGKKMVIVSNSLCVFLERPNYQIILTLISIFLPVLIILWSFKVTKSIQILGLNIAIILAMPDLRNLIVPSNLNFVPLLDFSFVVIWAAALLRLFLSIYQSNQNGDKLL